jgi:hypothetical protein
MQLVNPAGYLPVGVAVLINDRGKFKTVFANAPIGHICAHNIRALYPGNESKQQE